MAVDLPAPFGPSTARISPGRTSSDTPSRAVIAPNVFLTCDSRAMGRLNPPSTTCDSVSACAAVAAVALPYRRPFKTTPMKLRRTNRW
jgi:hypothetical protein